MEPNANFPKIWIMKHRGFYTIAKAAKPGQYIADLCNPRKQKFYKLSEKFELLRIKSPKLLQAITLQLDAITAAQEKAEAAKTKANIPTN